jgi:hypothetical protein
MNYEVVYNINIISFIVMNKSIVLQICIAIKFVILE